MLLLDTTTVSEFRRLDVGRADAAFAAWARGRRMGESYISVITLQEVAYGALLLQRRDPPQGQALMRWLDEQVRPSFRDRTLLIDDEVALRCAALHVPHRRPALDALIAATALVRGLTVVTRNVADFAPMGVPVLNPWEA